MRIVIIAFLLPSLVVSKDHRAIIENLAALDAKTDIAIFTDSRILEILDADGVRTPLKIFNILDTWAELEQRECQNENNTDFFDPFGMFFNLVYAVKYHTVVVHTKDLGKVLDIFQRTVLNCSHLMETGIYNIENRFLFIADQDDNLPELSEKIFESSDLISNHR